jgi:hypothetical protein
MRGKQVSPGPLPSKAVVKAQMQTGAGYISGTIYQHLLVEAGFRDPEIEITQEHEVEGVGVAIASATVRGRKPAGT